MTFHKWFLGFNLTYMDITDYLFMQCLNVTKLSSEKLEWLMHQLPNNIMVNYDSLKEQI